MRVIGKEVNVNPRRLRYAQYVRLDWPVETTAVAIEKVAFGAEKQTCNADDLVVAGSVRGSQSRIYSDRIGHSSGFSPLATSASLMSRGFERLSSVIFLIGLLRTPFGVAGLGSGDGSGEGALLEDGILARYPATQPFTQKSPLRT